MTTPTSASPQADVGAVIRGAGLKLTAPRSAVLRVLRDHPHASADEVLGHVSHALPKASIQSVYNALNDFVAAGLVRRIEPAGSPGLYEVRVDDNHHHLICTGCGAVNDVDCAVGHTPCLTPAETLGFVVNVAEVTYWGLCAQCSSTSSHAIPSTTHRTRTG